MRCENQHLFMLENIAFSDNFLLPSSFLFDGGKKEGKYFHSSGFFNGGSKHEIYISILRFSLRFCSLVGCRGKEWKTENFFHKN